MTENLTAQQIYAQLYDVHVPDWNGEVQFYRALLADSPAREHGVLEIACGTGRITLQLARDGFHVTGLDLSEELLERARNKSVGMANVNWVQGDMRTFELGKKFGGVIIPGHSFQFMSTPDDQVQCLEHIRRHLVADGVLVIHLDNVDVAWLGELLAQREPIFGNGRVLIHPTTQQKFRQSSAWTYEPATQTATVQMNWHALDENENVIQTWAMNPMRLHCIFPFEMEHLLKRVGFSIQAVHGDFDCSALSDKSNQMIWVAKNQARQ